MDVAEEHRASVNELLAGEDPRVALEKHARVGIWAGGLGDGFVLLGRRRGLGGRLLGAAMVAVEDVAVGGGGRHGGGD